MSSSIKIILLFGGESSEHEVSILSAKNVFSALDSQKYDVSLVYIDDTGKWWLVDSVDKISNNAKTNQLVPMLGEKSFKSLQNGGNILPDVLLPILHGKNGEDGAVQALAQLMHIPCVGCDMTSSAICMDKLASKQIAIANNVLVVEFEVHRRFDKDPDYNKLRLTLGNSLFVKPSRSGSSVGASMANNQNELVEAVKEAHKYDDLVIIERNVNPRELEVAVLGSEPDIIISSVGEIKPDSDFYSYESKYSESSKSSAFIPADIDAKIAQQVRDYARQIFLALGCNGLSRIDFFLSDNNKIYFNEINSLPGFTNISMYPKLLMHGGLSYNKIIERLIELALRNNN